MEENRIVQPAELAWHCQPLLVEPRWQSSAHCGILCASAALRKTPCLSCSPTPPPARAQRSAHLILQAHVAHRRPPDGVGAVLAKGVQVGAHGAGEHHGILQCETRRHIMEKRVTGSGKW